MSTQVIATTGVTMWDWPAGVTSVGIEAIGGGGGGGTATGNPCTGGGGKGGGYARITLTKGAETQLEVTVGAGGGVAGNGAASSVKQGITVILRATGGNGAVVNATSSSNGAGATAEVGTAVGTVTFAGGNGGTGNFTAGTQGSGAGGGAGGPTSAGGAANVNTAGTAGTGTFADGVVYSGAGAAGVGNSLPGANGPTTGYGGGGSGGKANSGADQAGGTGRQGVVVLTWTDAPTTMHRIQATGKARIANSSSPLTMSFSTPPTVGNGVIVEVWGSDAGGSPLTYADNWVTDNYGNVYKVAAQRQVNATTQMACAIYYCQTVVTTGAAFTVSLDAKLGHLHWWVGAAVEVGDVGVGKVLRPVATTVNAGSGTAVASGSTFAVTGEAFVAAVMANGATSNFTSITVPVMAPTWREEAEELLGATYMNGDAESRLTTFSGAISLTWTQSASANWAAALAAFQPQDPPAAPPPVTPQSYVILPM